MKHRNEDTLDYPLGTNTRKIFREHRYERRRLEFVQVRRAGGGAREKLRRRIGGFHQLHHMTDLAVRTVKHVAVKMGVQINASS